MSSHAGIPALRKLPCGVGSRYTGGTVCQRQASNDGILTLFFNVYWHLNARVIEIQTRQQLKNIVFSMKQRIFGNKFCIWGPNGQRTTKLQRFLKVTCLCCIFESTSAFFAWRALRNFAMADFEENLEEMVGTTREAAGGDSVQRGRDRRQDGDDGW